MVQDWQSRVRAGHIAGVVQELLTLHYDPVYLQSMRRNFSRYADAKIIAPDGYSTGAMALLAAKLLGD